MPCTTPCMARPAALIGSVRGGVNSRRALPPNFDTGAIMRRLGGAAVFCRACRRRTRSRRGRWLATPAGGNAAPDAWLVRLARGPFLTFATVLPRWRDASVRNNPLASGVVAAERRCPKVCQALPTRLRPSWIGTNAIHAGGFAISGSTAWRRASEIAFTNADRVAGLNRDRGAAQRDAAFRRSVVPAQKADPGIGAIGKAAGQCDGLVDGQT